MKVASFEDMALEGLKDIYDAEHQITVALPQMKAAATSPDLQEAFQMHLQQTQGQIARLEQVFQIMGQQAERKTCKATAGLIAEGKENIAEIEKGPVLDAALIVAAQKVEHYEIASYGSARTFAETMGHDDIAELLQQTLDEEEDTDERLTELAESIINAKAMKQ